jgi:hypothetical protein
MDVASSGTGMGAPDAPRNVTNSIAGVADHSAQGVSCRADVGYCDEPAGFEQGGEVGECWTGAAKTRGMNRPNMAMKIWKSIFVIRYEVKNIEICIAVQDC